MNQPVSPAEAELRRQLDSILDEAQRLRGDVHGAEVARRKATKINMTVLAVLAGFVAMLLAIAYQNNQLAANTSETTENTAKTNETIGDCTTPGGKCFEDGRKRTAAAINDIVKVSIYMAECARLFPNESGPAYDRKLEACVADRLGVDPRSLAPSPSASGG